MFIVVGILQELLHHIRHGRGTGPFTSMDTTVNPDCSLGNSGIIGDPEQSQITTFPRLADGKHCGFVRILSCETFDETVDGIVSVVLVPIHTSIPTFT